MDSKWFLCSCHSDGLETMTQTIVKSVQSWHKANQINFPGIANDDKLVLNILFYFRSQQNVFCSKHLVSHCTRPDDHHTLLVRSLPHSISRFVLIFLQQTLDLGLDNIVDPPQKIEEALFLLLGLQSSVPGPHFPWALLPCSDGRSHPAQVSLPSQALQRLNTQERSFPTDLPSLKRQHGVFRKALLADSRAEC